MACKSSCRADHPVVCRLLFAGLLAVAAGVIAHLFRGKSSWTKEYVDRAHPHGHFRVHKRGCCTDGSPAPCDSGDHATAPDTAPESEAITEDPPEPAAAPAEHETAQAEFKTEPTPVSEPETLVEPEPEATEESRPVTTLLLPSLEPEVAAELTPTPEPESLSASVDIEQTPPEVTVTESKPAAPLSEAVTPSSSPFVPAARAEEEPRTQPDMEDVQEMTVGYSDPFRYGEGSFIGIDPPAGFDIKANERSMKYHIPGAIGYVRCNTDVWFSSPLAAERAGFTRSQR